MQVTFIHVFVKKIYFKPFKKITLLVNHSYTVWISISLRLAGWTDPDRWSPWWANCLIQRSHFRTRNLRPGQENGRFFVHRFCLCVCSLIWNIPEHGAWVSSFLLGIKLYIMKILLLYRYINLYDKHFHLRMYFVPGCFFWGQFVALAMKYDPISSENTDKSPVSGSDFFTHRNSKCTEMPNNQQLALKLAPGIL